MKYGNVTQLYHPEDIVIFVKTKKGFQEGMLGIIRILSTPKEEMCFIKGRVQCVGKMYINMFSEQYQSILDIMNKYFPKDLVLLILSFNTI